MEGCLWVWSVIWSGVSSATSVARRWPSTIFLVLATAGTVILLTVGGELTDAGTAIDTWLNTNVTSNF